MSRSVRPIKQKVLPFGFVAKIAWANNIYDRRQSGLALCCIVSDFCNKAVAVYKISYVTNNLICQDVLHKIIGLAQIGLL
jgi:hypothetical protein